MPFSVHHRHHSHYLFYSMRAFSISIAVLLAAFFFSGCASKRVAASYTPEEVGTAIDNQQYRFVVRFVQPASGRMREVTGVVHTLQISKQEIVGDLPYFGRAFSAPIGTDGGIKFTSRDFTYDVNSGKRGAREVAIRVNNSQVVRDLNLTIFADGSADLRVTPVNRRFISYRGEVTPLVD